MVGCGVNSADNSNEDDGGNLIYKTKANKYDTIFHVKPPGVAIEGWWGVVLIALTILTKTMAAI